MQQPSPARYPALAVLLRSNNVRHDTVSGRLAMYTAAATASQHSLAEHNYAVEFPFLGIVEAPKLLHLITAAHCLKLWHGNQAAAPTEAAQQ